MKQKELQKRISVLTNRHVDFAEWSTTSDELDDALLELINQHVVEVIGEDKDYISDDRRSKLRKRGYHDVIEEDEYSVTAINKEKADQRRRAGIEAILVEEV